MTETFFYCINSINGHLSSINFFSPPHFHVQASICEWLNIRTEHSRKKIEPFYRLLDRNICLPEKKIVSQPVFYLFITFPSFFFFLTYPLYNSGYT